MAAPQTSPGRSLLFPPEILLHILSFVSDSYSGYDYSHLSHRNAGLAPLALVNRAFQAATYSVLYGDLRLAWMSDKVWRLFESFDGNPQLLPLVRRLEATAVNVEDWVTEQLRNPKVDEDDSDLKRDVLKDYCLRHGIEENSPEWRATMEDGVEDPNVRSEWEEHKRGVVEAVWNDNDYGTWEGEENSEGALELLDIVGSAPALRSLVVRAFDMDYLQATEIATRGPYPLLESLGTSGDIPYCGDPFFAGRSLPSFLASSSPNLRSLSGTVAMINPSDTPSPIIPLPSSLVRLEIRHYDPTIDTLLFQAQPSLRSLTLIQPSAGWASSPALLDLLSSLENLVVTRTLSRRKRHREDDLTSLTHAIALSRSLRHLKLFPATAELIGALPPSLQSITLRPVADITLPVRGDMEDPRLEMERVLGLLKAAATQPLRVEFLTDLKSEGREAWEEYRDAYAAMGHTLYVGRPS
ncbi:hypothetical protein RQP46_004163 [Phenoliferia psychrophenolica]